MIQRLSFLVCFLAYLERGELATRQDVAMVIGGVCMGYFNGNVIVVISQCDTQ